MRSSSLAPLALVLPLLLGAAGTSQHPIINGEAYGSDEYPSAGQLITDVVLDASAFGGSPEQASKVASCTATLIAPDVLLTAAHCIDETLLTFGILEVVELSFAISFEEDLQWMSEAQYEGNPPLPDDAVSSVGFVSHPGFAIDNFQGDLDGLADLGDIALVFLEEAITDRPHAYLPSEEEDAQLEEGMEIGVLGYGQQSPETGGPFDPPPEDINQRIGGLSFINELGEAEFQVGGDEETTRKCKGDSGGPSYVDVETDLEVSERVIGVTSRAYSSTNPQEQCFQGGVDTRVGWHLDWIEDELIAACESGLRVWCDEPGIPRPASGDDGDDGQACEGCSAGGTRGGAGWLGLVVALGVVRRRRG